MYKRQEHFLPDVVAKPTSEVLTNELEYKTNVLSKFARKEGDRIILRSYDDVSRRNAKMYEIESVVDFWNAEQAVLRDLRAQFKALPLENVEAKRKNLKEQEKLNKKKLEKSPVRYIVNLKNGVPLAMTEEVEDSQAEANMNTNSQEGDC